MLALVVHGISILVDRRTHEHFHGYHDTVQLGAILNNKVIGEIGIKHHGVWRDKQSSADGTLKFWRTRTSFTRGYSRCTRCSAMDVKAASESGE